MTYDRRKLIGSLVGGDLDSMNGIPDRYAELVSRQKFVIEVVEQIKIARANSAMTVEETTTLNNRDAEKRRAELNQAFKIEAAPLLEELYVTSDAMLAFIRVHFNNSNLEDPAVYQMVRDLFDGNLVVDTMDEDSLRNVEDAVVAIAVAKRMLSREKAPWNPQKMKEFNLFANRYKALILQ